MIEALVLVGLAAIGAFVSIDRRLSRIEGRFQVLEKQVLGEKSVERAFPLV